MKAIMDEQQQQIFSLFDSDNDGKIPISELSSLLRALNRAPTTAQLESLEFQLASSFITPADLPTILSTIPPINSQAAQAELLAAFHILDRDGTGRIASEELKRLVMTVGDKLSKKEADEMIKMADPEGKGFVEYENFIQKLILTSSSS